MNHTDAQRGRRSVPVGREATDAASPTDKKPSHITSAAHAAVHGSLATTLPHERAEPVALLEAGQHIGRYQIIRRIGRGGMGVVYLARDLKLGRRVALKLLRTLDADLTRRFIIEARATARCTHDNIVVIHEVGEHAGCPYMVLEYLEGKTLASYRNNPPSAPRIVEVIAAVARALVRAHGEGIVHRDLTPENVFLTDAGGVKVLDFGIAMLLHGKLEREVSDQTCLAQAARDDATTHLGTLQYMSPEQWGVGGPIDHRTDIWAVGMMLFELLAGQHPLDNYLHPGEWVSDLTTPLPSLRQLAPEVPEELARVVDKCLCKAKARRFADASELLRALEPFLPGHFASWQAHAAAGPYAGLRAFQEEDAPRFFGRSNEVSAVLTRLIETPLVGVVGPSGIGKSSLLRAGVVPTLKRTGEDWTVLTLRPGRDPIAALARALSAFPNAEPETSALRARLEREPGYCGAVLRAACRPQQRLLLFIDQFEECFTLGASLETRRAFTASLLGVADDVDSPLRVVLSLRADFIGRVAEHPELMRVLGKALFFLGAPSAAGLHEALLQPAEYAGYRFESTRMVEEMVEYLHRTPAGLPLLQFAAAQLWERRDPNRRLLTELAYKELGGVAGALVTHANGVINKLAPDSLQVCRALLLQLITEQRTRVARSIRELQQLTADNTTFELVLNELIDSRLLVVHSADGEAMVEIVHESLIRTWPALGSWLDQSHAQSVFLSRVLAAAREWDKQGRSEALLWGPDMAHELSRFNASFLAHSTQPPQLAQDFCEAVVARAKRRTLQRRALMVGSVVVLLALLAVATVVSIVFRRERRVAEVNAERARSAEERERLISQELRTFNNTLQQQKDELGRTKTKLEQGNAELTVTNTLLNLQTHELEAQKQEIIAATARAERERKRADARAQEARLAAQRDRDRLKSLEQQVGQIPTVLVR